MEEVSKSREYLRQSNPKVVQIPWFCRCCGVCKKSGLNHPEPNENDQGWHTDQPSKHLYTETEVKYYSEAFINYKRSIGEDLAVSLRIPLLFGAFVGLIPIQGLRSNGNQKFKYFIYIPYERCLPPVCNTKDLFNTCIVYQIVNILYENLGGCTTEL